MSDVHVDYDVNADWVTSLSTVDYQDDVLILAGDISDDLRKLSWCVGEFARRFRHVAFVPGNHDLWVVRDRDIATSLDKFELVARAVRDSGASMAPLHLDGVSVMPLLGWYDYTFGAPGEELSRIWMDFHACRWPDGWQAQHIAQHFSALNDCQAPAGATVISFSHFLPRIDVMPWYVPMKMRLLYPVLGSHLLEQQVRALGSSIHVYGHSHINRKVRLQGTMYVNNALAYPHETKIASKALKCVFETA